MLSLPVCSSLTCFRLTLLVSITLAAQCLSGQTESASVSGRVTDTTGRVVADARVKIINLATGTASASGSNSDGIYSFPSLMPGRYRILVRKEGFREVVLDGLVLNVQSVVDQNFKLDVGSVSESVTVTADAAVVNTTDATVSTVVDRQFAENLPLNGRSFQTLIQLTPGTVLTTNNGLDTGQFSINGQRAASNYWTVDGVSANIGISQGGGGNGLGGAAASTSALGGTNSLVSVDALQEFRVQTSTFAPEFGRTPGGQISIVTRSGTNQFHGTAFDYLRNDALDASDWFNGFNHNPPLPKAEERQNDFGGTLAGPILKNRTFFFFSYEGLRLRLPQTLSTFVPDLISRQNAYAVVQPFLNAFPKPNGSDNPLTNVAEYSSSFSNPATLDASSLRVDHKLKDRLVFFGRYDYSPSRFTERGAGLFASLSSLFEQRITTQTGTAGFTWLVTPTVANDFRFNYSRNQVSGSYSLDSFGGAVPPPSLPFPGPFTTQDANFAFQILGLGVNNAALFAGSIGHNAQRQINLIDNVSLQRDAHALKFGVDFRRLSPEEKQEPYALSYFFNDVPSAETGTSLFNIVFSTRAATFLFRNLGIFAQDSWGVLPRLTMTYGLRWDVDFVPSSLSGPSLNAVTGFDLADLSNLALLPASTPPYQTSYSNIGPRVGVAYELAQSRNLQTVLRGGFGLFYDLASSEAGNIVQTTSYPFGAIAFPIGTFPLNATDAAPPPIVEPNATNFGGLYAVDPHLRLPRALQWNVALEQSIGKQQSITASYIGSEGRRLLQTAIISAPNPNLALATLVTNAGTSDYNAFQLQFQRRLSRGLQALVSYTWSHSIDTASAGSTGDTSNALSAFNSTVNRGPSSFDRRNTLSAALTYDIPSPRWNTFAAAILKGWSTENLVQAQSAPPVDVYYSLLGGGELATGFSTDPRPDLIGNQPFYLYGSQYPGGKSINNTITPGACPDGSDMLGPFCAPPVNLSGFPTRQGTLGRNALRGFGMAQWDFAIHRDFPVHESVKLQFRAEMFNLLNHPNFGAPVGNIGTPSAVNPQFGQSIQTLGQSLSGGNVGLGALSPLYQVGGPRSIQLALKLFF